MSDLDLAIHTFEALGDEVDVYESPLYVEADSLIPNKSLRPIHSAVHSFADGDTILYTHDLPVDDDGTTAQLCLWETWIAAPIDPRPIPGHPLWQQGFYGLHLEVLGLAANNGKHNRFIASAFRWSIEDHVEEESEPGRGDWTVWQSERSAATSWYRHRTRNGLIVSLAAWDNDRDRALAKANDMGIEIPGPELWVETVDKRVASRTRS